MNQYLQPLWKGEKVFGSLLFLILFLNNEYFYIFLVGGKLPND